MSEFGKRLKFWRESLPKTLDEIESETGIDRSNFSHYERLAKSIPPEAIDKLKAYGAPITWILTGEGTPPTGTLHVSGPVSGYQAPKPSARDLDDADRYLEELSSRDGFDRKERFEWLGWLSETIAEKRALGLPEQQIEERIRHLIDLARRHRARLKAGRSTG